MANMIKFVFFGCAFGLLLFHNGMFINYTRFGIFI